MYLTMREVAERTGISAYTIRYYEKSGVLPMVRRSASGIRQFSETDLATLGFISDYKKAGLSLEEIARIVVEIIQYGCIIEQFERGETTEQSFVKRLALLREHQQRLVEQRDNIERMLAVLNQKIAVYEHYFVEQRAGREKEEALVL